MLSCFLPALYLVAVADFFCHQDAEIVSHVGLFRYVSPSFSSLSVSLLSFSSSRWSCSCSKQTTRKGWLIVLMQCTSAKVTSPFCRRGYSSNRKQRQVLRIEWPMVAPPWALAIAFGEKEAGFLMIFTQGASQHVQRKSRVVNVPASLALTSSRGWWWPGSGSSEW